MRCKRCTHFNLHCSLEGSPPRPKATVLPSINDSFPRVPSPPSHSHSSHSHAGSSNNPTQQQQQQQQHSSRRSPPAASRNFGPSSNTLRGPSPPPSASAPQNSNQQQQLSSTNRERHNYSSDSSNAPSPNQPYHPASRSSEYPPAPPIQHVQQQQQAPQYPQSSVRYNANSSGNGPGPGPNYREPLAPSANAQYSHSNRSHTPQQQQPQYPSGQHAQPVHQHLTSGSHSGAGWAARGTSVSPHGSAPVPPVPGPSPRPSSMGSRGGTPRLPSSFIARTDSSTGGGYGSSQGISNHSPSIAGSMSGISGPRFYQPPLRPLAPPSPPLDFDPRQRKTPMEIVATARVSIAWDKPASLPELRRMVRYSISSYTSNINPEDYCD